MASFDIDNDGDIDILNAEWWMNGQGNIEVPLFYINDGSGNFTVNDTDFLQASFYKEAGIDYAFTGVDAFDLDNDGFIDLIISGETDSEINYCIYDNPNNQFEQNCYTTDFKESIRIFWGSVSATFSEDNSSRLPLPYYANGNEKLSYGVNFVDLNGDGNYDIVNIGTNSPINGNYGPNSGGYIELYQNNGDRQFTNITDQSINVSEWDYANKRYVDTGDIPLFYDIGVVDVDNDGDFDFIPHTINTGNLLFKSTNDAGVDSYNWQTNIGKNFHWRNDGGYFSLVNDHADYEN
ncbi:VCBS repeat-containing protein [Flavobacteriaceae bacterium]|nr:VCBS repeat-containing protein [Flavobacteriaceae bacterium]